MKGRFNWFGNRDTAPGSDLAVLMKTKATDTYKHVYSYVDVYVLLKLLIVFILSVPVIRRFTDYYEAGNRGIVLNIAWRCSWVLYNLVELALIAAVAICLLKYSRLKWREHNSSNPTQRG